MADWSQYPEYITVAKRRAKNERAAMKLAKKRSINPIVITGRSIACTWWGKQWCRNLERYSDYSNRLPRGRSYVRHGSVIHLEINPGIISALVLGSRGAPYNVEINITKLQTREWTRAVDACRGKIDSLKDLMAGKFPKDLMTLFTEKDTGLFPSPKEITLGCSCPDWALMCKHVAAVLYGVGTRLDENPSLFFILRQVNQEELLDEALQNSAEDLVSRARNRSSRVMDDTDLGSVFGIEMNSIEVNCDPPSKQIEATGTVLDRIYKALIRFPQGTGVAELASASGLTRMQTRNAIARGRTNRRIVSPERGIYKLQKRSH